MAAIDIGGTKIAGALVDAAGLLTRHTVVDTPATGTADEVMAAVARVADAVLRSAEGERVTAVGIGSAGPVDISRGSVSPVNIAGWRDFPLVERVRALPVVGGRRVVLGGDGVALAAAEHWLGAARPYSNALCMTVSTGVGGGLILGGAVYHGPTGNAGHIGHLSVAVDGESCPCGGRGCVETMASGPAIARRALSEGWDPPGADRSAKAVAAAARAGDPVALAAFDHAARALAAGVAATAALVEIEAVVVGGGVAKTGDLLLEPLRRHLKEYASLPFAAGVVVVPAQRGTDAGLIGAAHLARGASGDSAA
ncbi:ROK family protein [Actinocrinis puniceicyclus]|uniref:ROK family protein n=1 Tax=Actinocrinis puniceicyclus TaxID=977794 RepID=A0A8J7WU96_9ACTN|nr:ROK family protein [Actinocrinis puniceicyclus]